ncbi:persephin [Rhynchocyon petersi]
MAMGGILLCCLLPLWLLLDPSWDPAALGSPVTDSGEIWTEREEAGRTQKPWLSTRHPIIRLRRSPASPCQLWSLTLPVAELGLGYTSEEKVVFSYCAGSCPHDAHTQHSLTLAWLQKQGRAHGGPCCRPTRYTDVAFLDDRHRWQRLAQLSAAACGCGD